MIHAGIVLDAWRWMQLRREVLQTFPRKVVMRHQKKFQCLAITLAWSAFINVASAESSIFEMASTATISATPTTPLFNQAVAQSIIEGYAGATASMDSPHLSTNAAAWRITMSPISESAPLSAELPDDADAALQDEQQFSTTATSFIPLCPTLNIDTVYNLSGLQQGVENCYHFSIDQRSKSTAFIVGQSSATDVDLLLLKDDGFNNLSIVGISENIGNDDEVITLLTEPGEYYWYMLPYSTDGTSIQFGVAVNKNIDAYEINDTVAQATVLPDKLNTIVGNADSPEDMDYYKFSSVRGQSVILGISGIAGSLTSSWNLALSGNGVDWTDLIGDTRYTLENLTPNQNIYLRVQRNSSHTWNINEKYQLEFGSKPGINSSFSVSSGYNPTLDNIPLAVAKFQDKMNWSGTILDTKNKQLEGVKAVLLAYTDVNGLPHERSQTLTSNSSGQLSGQINLGSCSGDYSVDYMIDGVPFRAWYKVGVWRIEVDGNEDAGVGGDNVFGVSFAQICNITRR